MKDDELEKQVEDIVYKYWDCDGVTRNDMKLAVIEAYKAGMESARKIYTT